MRQINVLIVDDSAVVRQILKSGLGQFPDINVTAVASDPYEARDIIVKQKPDVITLDIEMPRMDGLEFVGVLMAHMPLPIVIVSSLVDGKCETSLKALELGAVDIFAKPRSDLSRKLPTLMLELAEKVRAAAISRLNRTKLAPMVTGVGPVLKKTTDKVIAIGASTGGTEAIRYLLESLPKGVPGIVIVQHMPEHFTKAFADRLNTLCKNIEVKEAANGDSVYPGRALVAPGDNHLVVRRNGARYFVNLKEGPQVCRHRPSVEVLFNSMAEMVGKNGIGVLLTGMGHDGSAGLLKMRQMGARTIAQDEKSCVVYGMPKEALKIGAVELELSLNSIPLKLVEML